MIRHVVQRAIRRLPRVLINTTTGHLQSRAEQASAFESLPIFNELVSSMTTHMDYVRIKRAVRQCFRYVMLSHAREENEPGFQQVIHTTVYHLDASPTHDKLRMFCKITRDAGFMWAWSETCCVDISDDFVLQEALVAMSRWYQYSDLVIVFLRGVCSSSQRGALMRSLWNTCAWSLQGYVLSRVIRFYTEDWTPYLNLTLPNHKESLEVISEMEQATGLSAQQLVALRPGLTSVREKLHLASTRKTALVEDTAYSLLGIFSVTGMPVIYGEGEAPLGRLLAHILTGSGDTSILAWTGESGSFNSCLPTSITVFNKSATSHIPQPNVPILDTEKEIVISTSHVPSFDLNMALRLYDRLHELPMPQFAAHRLKLACIAFELPALSSYQTNSGFIYRADTFAFGSVEIRTRQDLSRTNRLYLIHPWLDSILDRGEETQSGAFMDDDVSEPPSPNEDNEEISDEEVNGEEEEEGSNNGSASSLSARGFPSPLAPAYLVPMDRETRARQFVARLRQRFGALLFVLSLEGDYRRVAADAEINVQFQESFSLADILDNVRILDVL